MGSSDLSIVQQFESLVDSLADLKELINQSTIEISECRAQKRITQGALNNDLAEQTNCYYIRNNHRIVLSAPEIIIGDVDRFGNLFGTANSSKVTIRTNKVALEGVTVDDSSLGSVTTRAPKIRSIAVDAGIDGNENCVMPVSSVVVQAAGVDIISDSSQDMFNEDGQMLSSSGINLKSDSQINVESVLSNSVLVDNLTAENSIIESQITELKTQESDSKSRLDELLDQLTAFATDSLHDSDFMDLASSTLELDSLNRDLESNIVAMYGELDTYFKVVSKLIEKSRAKGVYDDRIKELGSASSTFATTANNTAVSIRSELVTIASGDGDGNVRTVAPAGVDIVAQRVGLAAMDTDGTILDGGAVNISANSISLATNDCTTSDGEAYEYLANGDITMLSKSISLAALDFKKEKNKSPEESALSVGGVISMRAESVTSSGVDTEGKSVGSFGVNAKTIVAKSADVSPDDGSEQNIAADSSFELTAESVTVGRSGDDNFKTKTVTTNGDALLAQADTSVTMKQVDGATITIEKDKQTFDVKAMSVTGTSEFADNSEFKKKVTANEGAIDTLKVNSKFDSPKISNG